MSCPSCTVLAQCLVKDGHCIHQKAMMCHKAHALQDYEKLVELCTACFIDWANTQAKNAPPSEFEVVTPTGNVTPKQREKLYRVFDSTIDKFLASEDETQAGKENKE